MYCRDAPNLPLQSEEALKKMVDSIMAKLNKIKGIKKDLVDNYKKDSVERSETPAWLYSML